MGASRYFSAAGAKPIPIAPFGFFLDFEHSFQLIRASGEVRPFPGKRPLQISTQNSQ